MTAHSISETNIKKLKYGITNASAVIYNPSRNSVMFIAENQDKIGQYICVTFDLNNNLEGENAHKLTSIHGRENLSATICNLGADATICVQNKNKLDTMLPGGQILESLAPIAKVELI